MASGGYVSDEITNANRGRPVRADDVADGFLLDGYPRTLQQVETLDGVLAETGRAIDGVIALALRMEELVARLLKRAQIEGRADDTEEAIRVRQQKYAQETSPLLDVYRERGVLLEVDAVGPIDEVSERIFAAPGCPLTA